MTLDIIITGLMVLCLVLNRYAQHQLYKRMLLRYQARLDNANNTIKALELREQARSETNRVKQEILASPKFDEAEFNAMVEKGTKTWADVPDAAQWVDELRGNVD
jgi:hypothetical protein